MAGIVALITGMILVICVLNAMFSENPIFVCCQLGLLLIAVFYGGTVFESQLDGTESILVGFVVVSCVFFIGVLEWLKLNVSSSENLEQQQQSDS